MTTSENTNLPDLQPIWNEVDVHAVARKCAKQVALVIMLISAVYFTIGHPDLVTSWAKASLSGLSQAADLILTVTTFGKSTTITLSYTAAAAACMSWLACVSYNAWSSQVDMRLTRPFLIAYGCWLTGSIGLYSLLPNITNAANIFAAVILTGLPAYLLPLAYAVTKSKYNHGVQTRTQKYWKVDEHRTIYRDEFFRFKLYDSKKKSCEDLQRAQAEQLAGANFMEESKPLLCSIAGPAWIAVVANLIGFVYLAAST